jgi:Astacin (Peptidase family M12A)/Clostridial hydrophobic W
MKKSWKMYGFVALFAIIGCGRQPIDVSPQENASRQPTALPPRVVTRSTGPVLDAETLDKLRNSKAVLHRFSDGRVISFYNNMGDAVETGDHLILAPFAEIPDKITEYEKRIVDKRSPKAESLPSTLPQIESSSGVVTPQGVGIRANACVASFLDGVCLFQSGVPYVIDSSLNGANLSKVQDAINKWNSSNAGVKYRPRTSSLEPWVLFRLSDGCNSYVGRYQSKSAGGAWSGQHINLVAGNCLDIPGNIMHEMGHAAGLWHEQQRCDRDTFITVASSNDLNFGKRCYTPSTPNVAQYGNFDFNSVMFYGFGQFLDKYDNIIGTITEILPTPIPHDGSPIGAPHLANLSLGDQTALNLAYQLSDSPFTAGVQAHGANYGWQGWVEKNSIAGTVGQGRRIEGFRIYVKGMRVGLGITYAAHVGGLGWQSPVSDGGVAGTTGFGLRVEAFTASLTGSRTGCTLTYQAHVSGIGWMAMVAENAVAGTVGQNRQLEAMRVVVNCTN